MQQLTRLNSTDDASVAVVRFHCVTLSTGSRDRYSASGLLKHSNFNLHTVQTWLATDAVG